MAQPKWQSFHPVGSTRPKKKPKLTLNVILGPQFDKIPFRRFFSSKILEVTFFETNFSNSSPKSAIKHLVFFLEFSFSCPGRTVRWAVLWRGWFHNSFSNQTPRFVFWGFIWVVVWPNKRAQTPNRLYFHSCGRPLTNVQYGKPTRGTGVGLTLFLQNRLGTWKWGKLRARLQAVQISPKSGLNWT